jgi:putative membrane protein
VAAFFSSGQSLCDNLPCMKILIKWLLSATALLCVAYIYPGVVVGSFGAAMMAAFVIGLFNMVLRPVLVLLTLPVTLITLGLFLFVINALMFWAASGVLAGFKCAVLAQRCWVR